MRMPQITGLVKDHVLKNLDGYYNTFGWYKFPASDLEQLRVAPSGSPQGVGPLWAMGINYSMTGVFYNKALAAKIGMTSPPATLAQLDADLAKAKAAGVLPVEQFDSAGNGGLIFPLQYLMADYTIAAAGSVAAHQRLGARPASRNGRHKGQPPGRRAPGPMDQRRLLQR